MKDKKYKTVTILEEKRIKEWTQFFAYLGVLSHILLMIEIILCFIGIEIVYIFIFGIAIYVIFGCFGTSILVAKTIEVERKLKGEG